MKKEIQSIIDSLDDTLNGEPWYGKAVFKLLNEIDESKVFTKPSNREHSLIELLWHMNTWAGFTLANIEKRSKEELLEIEKNDWRIIEINIKYWKKGLEELKSVHKKIVTALSAKDDSLLDEIVPNRRYTFRYMLHGLIQHNIYHTGQIAYLKKLLG